jgi:preprotein translocase subunit SecY
MIESLRDNIFVNLNNTNEKNPNSKLFLTLFILLLFRFGNAIPLAGIDQEALKKSFLQLENKNAIIQIINMYAGGGGKTLLSPFSLGIIPFINASILIDLLIAIFPQLEKLQSEEGEAGRQKINFYKKLVTLFFAIVQSGFLIFYLKSYFYNTDFFDFFIVLLELVNGTMLLVWLSGIIDKKGIGNGTSLIIFTNIIVTLLSKNIFEEAKLDNLIFIEIFVLLFLTILICISQSARVNIEVVSARQLSFLENDVKRGKEIKKSTESLKLSTQLKENGLSIKLNQAGIFPIIIASNLIPIFSFFLNSFDVETVKFINNIIYYFLLIGFNYFYTIVFWDPEKISEQLRKASVSILDVTPGRSTVSYLENVVKSTSIIGGLFLCSILYIYDFIKQSLNGYLLNQINISSLIILVGVIYEVQKAIRVLYKKNY